MSHYKKKRQQRRDAVQKTETLRLKQRVQDLEHHLSALRIGLQNEEEEEDKWEQLWEQEAQTRTLLWQQVQHLQQQNNQLKKLLFADHRQLLSNQERLSSRGSRIATPYYAPYRRLLIQAPLNILNQASITTRSGTRIRLHSLFTQTPLLQLLNTFLGQEEEQLTFSNRIFKITHPYGKTLSRWAMCGCSLHHETLWDYETNIRWDSKHKKPHFWSFHIGEDQKLCLCRTHGTLYIQWFFFPKSQSYSTFVGSVEDLLAATTTAAAAAAPHPFWTNLQNHVARFFVEPQGFATTFDPASSSLQFPEALCLFLLLQKEQSLKSGHSNQEAIT